MRDAHTSLISLVIDFIPIGCISSPRLPQNKFASYGNLQLSVQENGATFDLLWQELLVNSFSYLFSSAIGFGWNVKGYMFHSDEAQAVIASTICERTVLQSSFDHFLLHTKFSISEQHFFKFCGCRRIIIVHSFLHETHGIRAYSVRYAHFSVCHLKLNNLERLTCVLVSVLLYWFSFSGFT